MNGGGVAEAVPVLGDFAAQEMRDRASCDSISNYRQAPDVFTGKSYRKVCAANIAELRRAAEREICSDGLFSKRCGLCHP